MAQRRRLFGEISLSASRLKDALLSGEKRDPTHREILPEASAAHPTKTRSDASCEGALLGIAGRCIVGWAWDRDKPHDAVDIELFIGDQRVGSGTADRFDTDLLAAKIGDGRHKFEVPLDRLPDTSPPFVIRAVIAGTEKELGPSLTIESLAEAEHLLSESEYVGAVTGIADGSVCGWVLNRSNPHEQPFVALYDGEQSIGQGTAMGRIRVVQTSGATVRAHGFSLPLPATALDGNQHVYSVRPGGSSRALSGSPVVFGPADFASFGRSIVTVSERVHRIERRLEDFEPEMDTVIEKRLATRILDRVDMLLNIHRDGIERELSVLRRQVTEIREHLGLRSDVISPSVADSSGIPPLLPVKKPFTAVVSTALAQFDLQTAPAGVTASGDVGWGAKGEPAGLALRGSGSITLPGLPKSPVSVVLRGRGASDPLEFCRFVTFIHGRVLTGRVDIGDNGEWTFAGTTSEEVIADRREGLEFLYLSDEGKPSGSLAVNHVAVYAPGKAPESLGTQPPRSVVAFLGSDIGRGGWYPVETTGRGSHRWMARFGELAFRIRQARRFRLTIPEIRPLVPDLVAHLELVATGMPVTPKFSQRGKDSAVYQLTAEFSAPADPGDVVRIRMSFPKEHVKSPKELGLNEDERPLTLAIRAVALSAVDT